MRDADVCILNQLIFLNDSSGMLRLFDRSFNFCARHIHTESLDLVSPVTFRKFLLEVAVVFWELNMQNNPSRIALCLCLCVCAHAHASLDMQSGSPVLSERSASIWINPVGPAAMLQQQFIAGANMRSVTALHPLL